jgi:hypothetical protein
MSHCHGTAARISEIQDFDDLVCTSGAEASILLVLNQR